MTTPIAAMVLEMIARGVDPEVIGLAVSTAELVAASAERPQMSRDESVTHRRESDRLRKQRSRDRLVTNRDVTGQSQVPLSKSIDLEEKREAVSADICGPWLPPQADWQDAVAKLGEPIASSELAKFREINRRSPGPKRDSDWRVWVQRAVDYLAKQKPAAGAAAPVDMDLFWHQACTTFKKFNRWHIDAGPDPDSPACKCPPEILQKHGLGSRAA